MLSFVDLIQQGSAHAWLFIPSAVLLGALHGLEPGHSKTMMAAFIVAIRGTMAQAVLLGLAATVSHTAIVWGIALGGMYLWRGVAPESLEPWLQLVSGLIVVGIALWMLLRTRKERRAADGAAGHVHQDGSHHDDVRRLDTGHGMLRIEIFETGMPPRWRIFNEGSARWAASDISVTTERPDGALQKFSFADRGAYLESVGEIAEPHHFMARVSLGHGDHVHDYDLAFVKGPGHDHMHEEFQELAIATDGYQDAHELAHANDIRRRFADRNVTTGQILLFGLTGGLIPCPAAITVLLLCLQLKEVTLGAVLVLSFSIGLAVTLVAVGAAAAFSVRHVSKRFTWFSTIARRAPYISSMLIIAVGLYMSLHGLIALTA